MKKSSKIAEPESGFFPAIIVNFEEPVETVDQDNLQLMDELDKDWVQAWRKETRKTCAASNKHQKTVPHQYPSSRFNQEI